jgi:hypothetical protein
MMFSFSVALPGRSGIGMLPIMAYPEYPRPLRSVSNMIDS